MADIYRISIGITLANRVSSVLGMIGRDFIRTQRQAQRFEATLKAIKLQMIVGGAMFGAGALGLSLVDKMVRHSTEYAHQIALLNTSGMTHLEIVKSIGAAWANMKDVPTATVANTLQVIRELRMVFGNTQDAIRYAPKVQQAQGVLSSLLGDRVGGDMAYTMAKAIEMKGGTRKPDEFFRQLDMMTKAMVASGGKVSGQDFQSAFKYGRTATIGWSDFFTYSILPTLIQEMKTRGGGSGGTGGPGSGLMSAFAAVVGGTISQKALKLWETLGLLDPTKEVFTKVHSLKGVAPGGVRGGDLFQTDPFAWVNKFLIPAMKAHGFGDDKRMREAIQYLFPNRTAGFMIGQMALQGWKFQRDVPLIHKASGLSAYRQLLKTDPQMAAAAMQAQWNNMMAILGYQLLPKLLPLAVKFTDWLSSVSGWMEKHQGITSKLVFGFTALSAAMAFGGSVLMLSAAFKGLGLFLNVGGLLVPGVRAVAGALGVRGGLLGALLPLPKALLGIALAAGAIYMLTHPVRHSPSKYGTGSFPDWVKNAGLDQDVGGWLKQHVFGMKPGEPFIDFGAPRNPRNDFERQEAAAKKRNDDLIHQLQTQIHWLGEQFSKMSVVLDGKKVGDAVTKRQNDQTRGPAARSTGGFNPRQTPAQP